MLVPGEGQSGIFVFQTLSFVLIVKNCHVSCTTCSKDFHVLFSSSFRFPLPLSFCLIFVEVIFGPQLSHPETMLGRNSPPFLMSGRNSHTVAFWFLTGPLSGSIDIEINIAMQSPNRLGVAHQ